MSRQRQLLARAVALVALTAAFAGSTSVFNSTYQAQAEVDARLSNGADVTVTESPGARRGPSARASRNSSASRAWARVEPLQHRFAYIGADLQDLYGVRPQTITSQGKLQNGVVRRWHGREGLMKILATQPDAILVSAETVHDYQLHPGDTHPAAAAERAAPSSSPRPVPLRGRRQRVPHRSEGLVLRRQPDLHRRPNRI